MGVTSPIQSHRCSRTLDLKTQADRSKETALRQRRLEFWILLSWYSICSLHLTPLSLILGRRRLLNSFPHLRAVDAAVSCACHGFPAPLPRTCLLTAQGPHQTWPPVQFPYQALPRPLSVLPTQNEIVPTPVSP